MLEKLWSYKQKNLAEQKGYDLTYKMLEQEKVSERNFQRI